MKLTDKLSIKLPFPGFYESIYSDAIDREAEQWAEYEVSDQQTEDGVPLELHLDEDTLAEILLDVTDYGTIELVIARAHVEAVDYVTKDTLGFALNLDFEEMTSPREYNFETDRVFASITYGRVLRLAALSRRDDHRALARTIRERFTRRAGFAPYYSNDLETWLGKPLASWDHNEIETLLLAVSEYDLRSDENLAIYYRIDDDFYDAWESSVNWPELDRRVAEKRNEKLAAVRAVNPAYNHSRPVI